MKDTLPDRVRLGAFEVDLRAGELNDGKRTICLQEQPLFILRMLVERAGEIVTRDELQRKLWPNDTVVDFDHGINAAIRRLRQALADSAEAPKYLGTVARRGYRLLLPVEQISASANGPSGSGDTGNAFPLDRSLKTGAETANLTGKKVSHYRVLGVIGGGGMGLVYEAEDLRLGRRVALKFLPEELAGDAVALHRFEREAQTASSLNHPNICTIYEIEEHQQQPFIVMELLEGETLRDRLRADESKVVPLDELLDIAIQTCEGLRAAQEKGIIHRDIKPANIFLTSKGVVKILDFGLAKLVEGDTLVELSSRAEPPALGGGVEGPAVVRMFGTADPSISCQPDPQTNRVGEEVGHSFRDESVRVADAVLTCTGVAMGTAGYMSPEQVRGEKLDTRTDIFSFGLVLYEMATGQRAFNGETAVAVHDAILNKTPVPLRQRNSNISPRLESAINRAIEKDRERRYQSAADMGAALQLLANSSREFAGGRSRTRSRWQLLAAVVVMAVAAIVAGVYWRSRRAAAKLTEQDTIVIADFDNSTGDPLFDDTLKQALAAQLSQSPFFNVLSDRKARAILKELNRSADEPLTEDIAREVCRHAGSKAMVAGSISHLHADYLLGVETVDCNSGDVLAEAQERAPDKETVLKALDKMVIPIRKQMGEPLSSVRAYAVPLVVGTTQSLEAWKSNSMGWKTEQKEGGTAALPFYKRAVEIDPSFARGYANLSVVYSNLNEGEQSEEYARKAYELRDKVSERDRLSIEANYYDKVTGELEKAAQAYELWRQNYPRDAAPVANLGGIYARLGNPEKFLEASRETMRLMSNNGFTYVNLATAYINLNRLDEAERAFKQAEQHNVTAELLLPYWYLLAFLKGDSVRMGQLAAAASGKPGTDDLMLASQADTDSWYGRYKGARRLTLQAMVTAKHNDAKETAAAYQVVASLREAAAGNPQQARADALGALKLGRSRDVQAMAALALAQAGDSATGERLADELNKTRPLDTVVQGYWLPTIRAAVALERKDAGRAIELLSRMGALETGANVTGVNVFLCPVYVRGQAYLMLGDGKAAAAEFQKFLEHYGLLTNFPWGALARLGLARAYALEAANDPAAREKTRTAYQNFLTLWKDADPDIPIYKQAKAEYAKLQEHP